MFLNRLSRIYIQHQNNYKYNILFRRYESIESKYGFERKMNDDLRYSVKSYTKHILICDGIGSHLKWPSKIEELGGLKGELAKMFHKDDDIRVIACDLPSNKLNNDELDLVYFDSNSGNIMKIEDVNKNNIKYLINYIKYDTPHPSLYISLLPKKASLVLVCAHQNKDKRCGYCGPIIADKIEEIVKEKSEQLNYEYVVTRVSHIGGHKYAANVIFYPQGDWYGYIKPEDVSSLIDTVDKGEILSTKWRGSVYEYKKD